MSLGIPACDRTHRRRGAIRHERGRDPRLCAAAVRGAWRQGLGRGCPKSARFRGQQGNRAGADLEAHRGRAEGDARSAPQLRGRRSRALSAPSPHLSSGLPEFSNVNEWPKPETSDFDWGEVKNQRCSTYVRSALPADTQTRRQAARIVLRWRLRYVRCREGPMRKAVSFALSFVL